MNFKLIASRSNAQAKRELENRKTQGAQSSHLMLALSHPYPASTITSAWPSLSYMAEWPFLG